jgi:CBS domain-containing protein
MMREKHIGYLVVVEPDVRHNTFRPIGVLTDRDIVVAVLARDVDPRSLIVSDVMSRQPVTISQDAPVSAALMEMRRMGVRRMPVVDQSGVLVGVLSLDDVVEGLAAELQDVAGSIRNERRIEGALRP